MVIRMSEIKSDKGKKGERKHLILNALQLKNEYCLQL